MLILSLRSLLFMIMRGGQASRLLCSCFPSIAMALQPRAYFMYVHSAPRYYGVVAQRR